MTIPSRQECLAIMKRESMPPHIQKHCFTVARIALYLGGLLNRNGVRLDLRLVESAALLHDIAKAPSLTTGESHGHLGAEMLLKMGFAPLAPIVRDHVYLDASAVEAPLTETVLVNYSDKRVKHDQVVTIAERFEDLVERYAISGEYYAFMVEKLELYRRLEARIFDPLPIEPDGAEIMSLSTSYDPMEETGES